MDKIVIFGEGYVAGKFKQVLPQAVTTKEDISDLVKVNAVLRQHNPDVVINCAGKTGRPTVDWCESHMDETWKSNVLGPQVLAYACLENNVFLAHVGSGCVYEGDNAGRGYSEEDAPNFFGSYYSRTKIASEQALDLLPVLQLRLRMPVDCIPGPRNFITKITNYKRVISVPNSISVMDDFVFAAIKLIDYRAKGVYNVVNPGSITHKEILDMYREIVNPAFVYELFSVDELHRETVAKRSNCVLSTKKIETLEILVPEIHGVIRKTLITYKNNLMGKHKQSL
ncbi:MAG: sugar nucleotide-binding protein [Candidatus Aenigmarchaeota archaeon]|nr:sugar nucleotide-binding protein [Candidatus Aenigmarchaeota archaeon]